MKQNKFVAMLLRKLADMAENDECAPDALERMAEMQLEHQKDHERIQLLTTAVTLLMDDKKENTSGNDSSGKIVQLHPKK